MAGGYINLNPDPKPATSDSLSGGIATGVSSPTKTKPTLLNAPVVSAPGKGKRWTPEQIGAAVARACEGTSTDPLVVLAVFDVESGFDHRAVGDGGNSFGLRQLNVNGQLNGHSKEWAFDPNNAIPDAVRALAGVRDGKGAAAVQRPADRKGYAVKVDGRLAKLRKAFNAKGTNTSGGGRGKKWSPERAAVAQVAKTYGLRHTSGDRQKKHTATGGVSDHWVGSSSSWADDYAGPMERMKAFQRAMQARGMKQVIGPLDGPSADHMDHVHVAGYVNKPGGGADAGAAGSADAARAAIKAGLSGSLQKAALGALAAKTVEAVSDAQGAAVDAAADAAGAVAGAITDGVKLAFRYGLVLALILAGAALIIVGLGRAAGEATR